MTLMYFSEVDYDREQLPAIVGSLPIVFSTNSQIQATYHGSVQLHGIVHILQWRVVRACGIVAPGLRLKVSARETVEWGARKLLHNTMRMIAT